MTPGYNPTSTRMIEGTYTGNNTVDRAIPHGLGRIPRVVLIWVSGGNITVIQSPGAAALTFYSTAGAGNNLAVTAMDATNFYVGNATSYGTSANALANNYNFLAF